MKWGQLLIKSKLDSNLWVFMYDIVVVGAGIVGLASALKILEKDPSRKLLILEKENKFSAHQTGNNSGVIHSGIYYPKGTSKAKLCRSGYSQLLDFCDENEINYDLCGKLIVATEESELDYLSTLRKRAAENGLEAVREITKEEAGEYEPHLNCIKALHVPQAGIINYSQVSEVYLSKILSLGGEIKFSEAFRSAKRVGSNMVLKTDKSDYETKYILNCAGLYSDKVAEALGVEPQAKILPFRGEYYELKKDKEYLVKDLIYPVPNPKFPFLGVHFTRMIDGGIEAGPNAVLAFGRESYRKTDFHFRETMESLLYPGFHKICLKYYAEGMGELFRSWSKYLFVKSMQKMIPEISMDDVVPGGAGIRAQACGRDGQLFNDFVLESELGVGNVINAPSPAATSSLAIGDSLCGFYEESLNSAQ